MHVYLAVPCLLRGFLNRIAGAGSGVVHQDVQGPVCGDGGGDGVDPVLLLGHVELDENGVTAGGADLLGGAFAALGVDVSQDDSGALATEHPGGRTAEAHQFALHTAGGSTDERNLAFQSHRATSCLPLLDCTTPAL